MNNRDFRFKYGAEEYVYYEDSSLYILNWNNSEEQYFVPPTIGDIIAELPTEKAQKLLEGIINVYWMGMEKGKIKFQKEIKNTLKSLFDLEDED